ncbi:MAG: aminotransferase class V-fold PLP-dependent enzyme [Gemmatimonadaceae bacterium]
MTSRREFVQRTVAAGAMLGVAPADPPVARDENAPAVDYYERLGVAKIINAAGTYTYLTASLMPPSVQAAVALASQHSVRLRDLQSAAGTYLAERLHCEAALVSCGAASALSLGTAACMTLGSADGAKDLPARANAYKREVIIQKGHRLSHEHALEMCGAQLVEVQSADEYERAFTAQTAMAFYFNAAEEGDISREAWVRVARAHNVPCFLDAAADVPPIANLWNYTAMGFDLVAFSGGKGIRGPQNAGLLLGRKALIEAAAANNNPNDRSLGRGMKVAKEQIVGMVAAVDWLLAQNDDEIAREAQQRADRIVSFIRDLPSITTEVVVPAVANHVPHLLIRYDQQRIGITPVDVALALRNGKPSIELNPGTGHASGAAGLHSDERTIVIGPWMMKPGDDVIVGRRLREVLAGARRS